MTEPLKTLFSMQDIKYKEFHQRLIPTVDPELIIGIRTPYLRKYAAELSKTAQAKDFLTSLPHKYYEENNLHAFLLERITDFDEAAAEAERFLPFIDNWATCDMFLPKVFKKNRGKILPYIYKWLETGETYTVRYAVGLLMKLFLDGTYFEPHYLETVSCIRSDEYYIKMMQAWYFQAALCKQFDAAVVYLTEGRLDKWVHNKAIQKARESRLMSAEMKEYLKTLRR